MVQRLGISDGAEGLEVGKEALKLKRAGGRLLSELSGGWPVGIFEVVCGRGSGRSWGAVVGSRQSRRSLVGRLVYDVHVARVRCHLACNY
jgi:hypothetical protein